MKFVGLMVGAGRRAIESDLPQAFWLAALLLERSNRGRRCVPRGHCGPAACKIRCVSAGMKKRGKKRGKSGSDTASLFHTLAKMEEASEAALEAPLLERAAALGSLLMTLWPELLQLSVPAKVLLATIGEKTKGEKERMERERALLIVLMAPSFSLNLSTSSPSKKKNDSPALPRRGPPRAQDDRWRSARDRASAAPAVPAQQQLREAARRGRATAAAAAAESDDDAGRWREPRESRRRGPKARRRRRRR